MCDCQDGSTALMEASAKNSSAVGQLLAKGADVNARDKFGWTALMYATDSVTKDSADVVGQLLAKGAHVNVRNKDGMTALMYASWEGNAKVVKQLLAHGADVTMEDMDGWAALEYAENRHPPRHEGHVEVAEQLLVEIDAHAFRKLKRW